MIRRQKLALFRLEKISESSSPTSSPKKKQPITHRVNPMTLTSITFKDSHSPPKQKNNEILVLQEEIMNKRQQYTLWDEAAANRNNSTKSIAQLFTELVRNVRFLGLNNLEVKHGVLRAVKKGRKGVIRWMLSLIKELFWIVLTTLSRRRTQK